MSETVGGDAKTQSNITSDNKNISFRLDHL